jgi:uncharacterized protein (TIGR02099 family)
MIIRKLGRILLEIAAGLVALVLLLLVAVKVTLDRAPRYQAQIKEWVHAQTGYHIGFEHVSPAFRWYGPELYFDHLELRSKDDQRILARAHGGRIGADIWQLIRSGKLLAGRIEIDSPDITVARLGPGRFAVASEIELGGDDSSLGTVNFDDLPAGNLLIRHAALTLQNWNEALPQLTLRDVNLDLRRGDGGLRARFTSILPPALGGTVSLSATANGHGDVQTAAWKALVRARGISFLGWHEFLPEYLGGLDGGNGSFEAAAEGHGRSLERADLDFGATGVLTKLAEGPMAKFDQMNGTLTLQHTGERWSLSGKHVRAARGDPESAFDVSWRGTEAGLVELSASATYLRAETLLPLTGFLPQQQVRDLLRDVAPTGEWTDSAVTMQRQTGADPWALQIRANFHDAGFAPVRSAPGLRGLNGSVAGTEAGGHLFIDSAAAVFNWPTQLPQPLDLPLLKANFYWKKDSQELLVAGPDWQAKTRDGAIHGKLSWQQPADGSSPVMTLVGTVENGNVANARNYFPRGLLAPNALNWLNRAFVAGHLSRADAVIQGPIRHYPFRDGSGIFLVRAAFDSMTLDYSDGWPMAENLSALAEFRNEGMSAKMQSGRIGDVVFSSADAKFPDFKTGELRIRAAGKGEAAAALAFLRSTPLDASADHVFSNAEISGALSSNVDLFLPFKDFVNRRVLVHGVLDGATLNMAGGTTKATEVSGDFDVDNGQISHADLHGQILGGAFQMAARVPRSRPLTRTQLEFHGTLSAEALHEAISLPPTVVIGGQTDWRAVLKITPEPARERSLRVSSSLAGLELQLPAPLNKPAGTPLPSWLEVLWPANSGPQGKLALGSLVSGSYALASDAGGLHLASAALQFGTGDAGPSGSQIFNVGGSVERVDLAGWLKLSTPDKNSKPLSYYLRDAKLDVAELDYLGLAFRDVSLNLTVSDANWRIAVGGPNVAGSITVPTAAGSAEPWNLQFDRLRFAVADREDTASDSPEPAVAADAKGFGDPHGIPAINFHAAQLVWGDRKFGDVQATLTKLDDGVSLKQLIVSGPSLNATLKGEWRGKDAGTSRIQGSLTSSDVQDTLKELGYADVIQARSGKMEFDLSWEGAPTAEAVAQAAGHVQLSMDKGQVTGLKPGAGRLLGLASIAALPRRLALDFSDLTDKGLAFDTVRGDFDLRDGNAFTENVLLKGPAAEIGLIGRVGLKNKDYDQTAVVTGSFGNSLSIPVAGALVAGPIGAAAVLLFTQVFKQPLKGLTRGYYRITGSWDNPTVERIKSADAAAATAEASK